MMLCNCKLHSHPSQSPLARSMSSSRKPDAGNPRPDPTRSSDNLKRFRGSAWYSTRMEQGSVSLVKFSQD